MVITPPKGQPHRQQKSGASNIAVAHIDPCLIYLEMGEATSPEEFPPLLACWARSSHEVQKSGQKTRLKLNNVFVVIGTPQTINDGGRGWHFLVHEREELIVESNGAGVQSGFSLSLDFQNQNVCGSRGEIAFIDQDTDVSLEKFVFGKPRDRDIARKILEVAPVDWPSLRNAEHLLQKEPVTEIIAAPDEVSVDYQNDVGAHLEASVDNEIYNCGRSLYEMGEYEMAADTLQLTLKNPHVRYQALNLIGLSLLNRGMPDVAVKQLTLAASELPYMDETSKAILYNLGLAYEESQCAGKALDQWKKIFECDMGYRDVARRVEESYGNGGVSE